MSPEGQKRLIIPAPGEKELPLSLVFWKNPASWSAREKQVAIKRLRDYFKREKAKKNGRSSTRSTG
jgi:hypothetical protein